MSLFFKGTFQESFQGLMTAGWMLFCIVGFCVVGCGPQDATPKASHFEHDHDVAPHWPSDLADAANKIRERLVWMETGEVPEHDPHEEHDGDHDHDSGHDHDSDHEHEHDPASEIADLVSWVPEIAADTNLSEEDWLPLYQASESLMSNLRASNGDLNGDNQTQVESLCELIDEAVSKIPDHLASLKVTSP